MSEKEKIELLMETFDVEGEIISSSDILSEMEWWDSLSKLSLVVMLEEEFGYKLTTEKVSKFITVKDILDIMEKK